MSMVRWCSPAAASTAKGPARPSPVSQSTTLLWITWKTPSRAGKSVPMALRSANAASSKTRATHRSLVRDEHLVSGLRGALHAR